MDGQQKKKVLDLDARKLKFDEIAKLLVSRGLLTEGEASEIRVSQQVII